MSETPAETEIIAPASVDGEPLRVVAAEDEFSDSPGVRIERLSRRDTPAAGARKIRKRDLVALEELRPSLAERVRQDFPDLGAGAMISNRELARYRKVYVEEMLQQEHGEFSELDRQVAESLAKQDTIAENIEEEFSEKRTFGEVLSDHLAKFAGSWAFLILFFVVLFGWMIFNLIQGEPKAFDPYPFILLNLVLSCIAAVQAPIIIMSQKRQEEKDRLRGLNDYRVNLKAELEIRHLHEKIDYLISKQWSRMAELQQMQLEIMQESRRKPARP